MKKISFIIFENPGLAPKIWTIPAFTQEPICGYKEHKEQFQRTENIGAAIPAPDTNLSVPSWSTFDKPGAGKTPVPVHVKQLQFISTDPNIDLCNYKGTKKAGTGDDDSRTCDIENNYKFKLKVTIPDANPKSDSVQINKVNQSVRFDVKPIDPCHASEF